MSRAPKPLVTPKITLSDGSVFELLPQETVEQGLARAEALTAKGLRPADVKADGTLVTASGTGKPSVTSLSYEDDIVAKPAEAIDRERAGAATESDKLLLGVARGKGGRDSTTIRSKFVAEALIAMIHRVERVNAEIKDLQLDRREIFKEVGMFGFDVPTVKRVIRLRKLEADAREEQAELDKIYLEATQGEDGRDIPLTGLPAAKKERKQSQARAKKDAARAARLADEQAACADIGGAVEDLARTAATSTKARTEAAGSANAGSAQ